MVKAIAAAEDFIYADMTDDAITAMHASFFEWLSQFQKPHGVLPPVSVPQAVNKRTREAREEQVVHLSGAKKVRDLLCR